MPTSTTDTSGPTTYCGLERAENGRTKAVVAHQHVPETQHVRRRHNRHTLAGLEARRSLAPLKGPRYNALTRDISVPSTSSVWIAQAIHGSNEWIGAEDFERPLGVGDRVADERRFVGSRLVLRVARAGVPRRRHDRLVVLDLAVLDDDPVRQRAARRFVEAEPLLLAFRKHRLVEDSRVAFADVLGEQLPVLARELGR